MDLSPALIGALPKVALHDHLDGGVRAATVLELSRELGTPMPWSGAGDRTDGSTGVGDRAEGAATRDRVDGAAVRDVDATAVADWFHDAADSGSLPSYLSTFERTVAIMQTAPQLRRIAREFVEDMVADGVVYAETRWAPHQHTDGGLSLDEAVQAVQDGLDAGVAAAAASGRRIVVGQLLCYLRHLEPTDDLVDIALARRDAGVVGLDLAGPEAGFPASRFTAQFRRAREEGLRVTIHAGEADGPDSIADALNCGAERLGHGVRVLEDVTGGTSADGAAGDAPTDSAAGGAEADRAADGASASPATADTGGRTAEGLGPIAERVLRERICLEVCPSSNLQTAAAPDLPSHPVGALHERGFAVALSSDNRLMSRTSTSREMTLVARTFDWSLDDLEQVVLTGLEAGFVPAPLREALRDEVVLPAFHAVRQGAGHTSAAPDATTGTTRSGPEEPADPAPSPDPAHDHAEEPDTR